MAGPSKLVWIKHVFKYEWVFKRIRSIFNGMTPLFMQYEDKRNSLYYKMYFQNPYRIIWYSAIWYGTYHMFFDHCISYGPCDMIWSITYEMVHIRFNNAYKSTKIPINEEIDIGTCSGVCHGTNSHDFRFVVFHISCIVISIKKRIFFAIWHYFSSTPRITLII